MQNFMQIRPSGAFPQMGEYTQKILSIDMYTFLLQRTYRSDPLGNFYARWLKRRGIEQGLNL